MNFIFGGLSGKSWGKLRRERRKPPSYSVSDGLPQTQADEDGLAGLRGKGEKQMVDELPKDCYFPLVNIVVVYESC